MGDARYFVRVTPANYVYALLLSFRRPVAVWKVGVPEWLAKRFQRVRPYRIFTRDQWLLAHDAAFDLWKTRAFPIISRRHRVLAGVGGRNVDFSRNLWQMLGIEFEALSLLDSMLQQTRTAADGAPCIVEPRVARAFKASELEALFPRVSIARSPANRWLESVHEWSVSAAHLARTLLFAASSFFRPRLQVGPRAVVWLGVSAVEIPDTDARLNFAWASQYGYLDPRQVLYFLPSALQPDQAAYLHARKLQTLEPGEVFAVLSPKASLQVAMRSIAGFCAALTRPSTAAAFVARFMSRAPYWHTLFTTAATRAYVTTTSYSWPEKPELAVAAAAGIRSIIWAYSANSLAFSIADRTFRDTGITRSILVANEFWAWNKAYAHWLVQRQVEGNIACSIRVVGPLMCGDPRLLRLDARTARERLGMPATGICIGVFDMPPISDAWRDRFGGGPPMVDMEMYVAFWALIERIVERVPESMALIKMKRGFGHLYREFPPMVKALLDEEGVYVKTGRVHIVDVNVDPYLPIAASDVALGITYTSPILAARGIGRPAYYVDPLGRANFPPNRDYAALTLTSEEEVVAMVLAAKSGLRAPATANTAIPPAPMFPLRLAHDGSIESDAGGSRAAGEPPSRIAAAGASTAE